MSLSRSVYTPLLTCSRTNMILFCSYLQTVESVIHIREAEALYEHGLTAIRCLLSGFDIFDPTYNPHNRNLRILRGLHGFHIYAAEHWVEYLLSNSHRDCGLDESSSLYRSASALAQRLAKPEQTVLEPGDLNPDHLDRRLENFRHQRAIYSILLAALKERSTKAQDIQREKTKQYGHSKPRTS